MPQCISTSVSTGQDIPQDVLGQIRRELFKKIEPEQ